ncbi:MAG: HipA-like protein, partial [Microcoleus sp. T1-bin1]|nr:HipA-like protein [Microcoleus sp. T1-bin1]
MADEFPVIVVPESDYDLSEEEQMGTKNKFWFPHSEFGRCLYKQSRPNTGEDWAEKIAAELCELLGLPHALYELAETWEGNYGVVSPSFLPSGGTLVHGNEILTPLVPNYPTSGSYKVSQYTIDVVLRAIEENPVAFPIDWTA